MFSRIESNRRSNHSIFLNYGSPINDAVAHIPGLELARIDSERCAVDGEVICSVGGDLTPRSQQDEEARIATLAHAIKKLGNPEPIGAHLQIALFLGFEDSLETLQFFRRQLTRLHKAHHQTLG